MNGRKTSNGRKASRTNLFDAFVSRLCLTTFVVTVLACSHAPPPDFAPDPGLVQRIRELRMSATPRACPGETFGALYTAVLDDGSLVPFATRYDKKHPPRLHVMFLERTSDEATPLENGGWAVEHDPLRTVATGFRLHARLLAKPAAAATVSVAPDYSCLPHAFRFEGPAGTSGQAGYNGPQVTVRLGIARSPFYERLLIAGLEVENAPPFYVLADANAVPPADWLIIEARGGRGGHGLAGARGSAGTDGQAGCPGSPGGPGGPGGNGGPGAAGGRGGRVTIIVPQEEPFLAGLVDGRAPGGAGGEGGAAGKSGAGGKGGAASPADDRRCTKGGDGAEGRAGAKGADGPDGAFGARAQVLTIPARDVFGTRIPPELADLLERRR